MIEVRPIEKSDLPALRDLLGMLAPFGNRALVDRWLGGWPRERERGVVAEGDAGQIVGACWFRPTEMVKFPELIIVVRPDSQGQGVGRSLLEANVAQAMELGLSGVMVAVRKDNPAALSLLATYELGFTYETPEEFNVLVLNPNLRSRAFGATGRR